MCQSCLESFTLSPDNKTCDPCASGKFGASPGVCTNCTAGRYEDSKGSLTCKECARGQSQEHGGKTACSPCDVGTFANVTLLEQCYDCPKGYYVEYPGSASCFSCSPGKFAPAAKSLKCDDCPSGRLQRFAEQSLCYSVEAGQVVAEGGSASIQVPLGSKICSDSSGCTDEKAPFEACMPGTYGYEPATTLCQTCPAGWSSVKAAAACQPCDKGRYNPTNGGLCEECPIDTYQDQFTEETLACKGCPTGFHQEEKGESSCQDYGWQKVTDCKDNEYLNNTASDLSLYNCVQCPLGGNCVGPVNWTSIGPLFGWWKIPQDERLQAKKTLDADLTTTASNLVFIECMFPPACLGAANPLLFERYPEAKDAKNGGAMSSCNVLLGFNITSRLCHTCTAGYRRQGSNRCSKCPDAGANWGLILLGGLVIFLVLAFIVIDTISEAGDEQLSASLQKIILNYLQVVTLFGSFPLR